MPGVGSTPTTRDRFELQQPGRNLNQWGQFLNVDVFQLMDDSFDGQVQLTTTGGGTVLSVSNYATDQARQRLIIVGGTLTSAASIILPSGYPHYYFVVNNTSGAFGLNVGVSGGTSAVATQGAVTRVYTDGTNTSSMEPTISQLPLPTTPLNMNGQKIVNMGAGTAATDGASLSNRLDQFAVPIGPVSFNSQKITSLGNATIGTDGMNLTTTLAQTLNAFAAPVANVNMAGFTFTNLSGLSLNSTRITSLSAGVAGADAVNLSQMTTAIANANLSATPGTVRISVTDTTADYLAAKLSVSGSIVSTITNPSANALMQINLSGDSVAPAASSYYGTNVSSAKGFYAFPTPRIFITRSPRTSNTILGVSDFNTFVDITSGTFTQTITASATLGAGWWVDYRNFGTGVITIDPNGSETINGLSTIRVYPGESFTIECDGSNLFTIGRQGAGSKVLISSVNPGAVASVDIAVPADPEFDSLNLSFNDLDTTGGLKMRLQTSSTIIIGSVYLGNAFAIVGGPTSVETDTNSATAFNLSPSVGNPMDGELTFPAYQLTSISRRFFGTIDYSSGSYSYVGGVAGGNISADPNGMAVLTLIRLLNSGTLGGTVRLYGIRK